MAVDSLPRLTFIGNFQEIEILALGGKATSVRQQTQVGVEIGIEQDAEHLNRAHGFVELRLRRGSVVRCEDSNGILRSALRGSVIR